MRHFYNYTANISRDTPTVKKWSLVSSKTVIYSGIRISLWKARTNYSDTTLAVGTKKNSYEINFSRSYTLKIGDTVSVVGLGEFVVDQVILHHNSRGRLDNVQAFVSEISS